MTNKPPRRNDEFGGKLKQVRSSRFTSMVVRGDCRLRRPAADFHSPIQGWVERLRNPPLPPPRWVSRPVRTCVRSGHSTHPTNDRFHGIDRPVARFSSSEGFEILLAVETLKSLSVSACEGRRPATAADGAHSFYGCRDARCSFKHTLKHTLGTLRFLVAPQDRSQSGQCGPRAQLGGK